MTGSRWERAAVAAGLLSLVCACEVRTLDLDDPSPPVDMTGVIGFLDEEAIEATGTPPAEWACADGASGFDSSLTAPPELLTLSLDIVDVDGDGVVPRLSVADCGRLDTACFAPRAVTMLPTEAPHRYSFALPFQWGATLQLTAPGYVDIRYFVDGVLRASRSGDVIEMYRSATFERLLGELGAAPDPEQGLLFIRFLDCNGNRVPGASVQISDNREAMAFHVAGGRAIPGGLTSDSNGVIGLRVLVGFLIVEGFVSCSNGQLPRRPSPVSYRLHALGAPPAASAPDSQIPVCDSNGEALIGSAAIFVGANLISIGEIRPGNGP